MEQLQDDRTGLSQISEIVTNREEGHPTAHGRPVGLTITVEKLDRALAGLRAQMAMLRRERTNLGFVRGQLASMEAKWRAE